MEFIFQCVLQKIDIMKKILLLFLLICFTGTLTLFAQTDKKVPPPPPPPKEEVKREVKKVEMVKFTPPIAVIKEKDAEEFYSRNPSVSEIARQGNSLLVKLKNGTKEKYNLENEKEKKSFEEKYGDIPFQAPPPPPKPVKS